MRFFGFAVGQDFAFAPVSAARARGVFDAGRGRKTKQEVFEQREQRLERKISQLVAEIILHAGGGILCASV